MNYEKQHYLEEKNDKNNEGTKDSPLPCSSSDGELWNRRRGKYYHATLCSKPPTLCYRLFGLGVRPSRHSYDLIQRGEEFVVNLPSVEQAKALDYCGIVSGRDEDKWEACGFTQGVGSKVNVPLIDECPVNLECRLEKTLSLGSHDLFIGEVVAIQVDEDVLDARGRLDMEKAKPLAYLNGEYRQIGKLLGTFGYSK